MSRDITVGFFVEMVIDFLGGCAYRVPGNLTQRLQKAFKFAHGSLCDGPGRNGRRIAGMLSDWQARSKMNIHLTAWTKFVQDGGDNDA
jgi:hypothetical protein